jgi:hypothetical protein
MEGAFCFWLRRSKAHPNRGLESQHSETGSESGSESVFCRSLLAIVAANSASVYPPLVADEYANAAHLLKSHPARAKF